MRLFQRRGVLLSVLLVIGGTLAAVAVGRAGTAAAPPTLTVSHRARALQPGEPVLMTITSTAPLTSVEVRAFGRMEHVRAVADPATTWQAIVGLDLDVAPGIHSVNVSATSASGPATATHTVEVAPKNFPTRRLTVDPNFVNPPASAAARIAAEAAELATLWTAATVPAPIGPLAFIAPVPHPANSAFGTRSIFNGEPRGAHGGADFLSPTGTPVKAPAPGRIVLAKDLYYTGGTVVIDHGFGIVSLFAHLSAITVRTGDDVAAGLVVGRVGATGRVTGAHLHWTVRVTGARVDPIAVLAVFGANQPTAPVTIATSSALTTTSSAAGR
jgi:murein DD-endopeptidase MepM/ murein hydrolase activator NlpD